VAESNLDTETKPNSTASFLLGWNPWVLSGFWVLNKWLNPI
jgi:hypothetical protein